MRRFGFPELKDKRGMWVIDFYGNGKSSRALIRKGALDFLVKEQPGAMVITIYDENQRLVPEAEFWMSNRRFVADDNGEVTVPYPATERTLPVIVSDGRVARRFEHHFPQEHYSFQVDCRVEDQSLIAGEKATVLLRPRLYLNGRLASLDLIKDATLVVGGSTSDRGVHVEESVPNLELSETREIVHTFTVPPRVTMLRFSIRGKIRVASQFDDRLVVGSSEIAINGLDGSLATAQAFLLNSKSGFAVEVRDKSGLLLPETPVTFRFFREIGLTSDIALRTDASGTIDLGMLTGVDRVTASVRDSHLPFFAWNLGGLADNTPAKLHGHVDRDIELRWFGESSVIDRRSLSLLEVRHGKFVRDWFSAASHDEESGLLRIAGLPRGDFVLSIPHALGGEEKIRISVAGGNLLKGHVVSDNRLLELPVAAPLQISSIDTAGDTAVIQLSNANPFTRVHLIATYFAPVGAPGFNGGMDESPGSFSVDAAGYFDAWKANDWFNLFASGRNLGDEYRYIYDRQHAKRFPGNMLPRPGLLLNPWSVRKTSNRPDALARPGTEYSQGLLHDSGDDDPFGEVGGSAAGTPVVPWSFHFLRSSPVTFLNLEPDDSGRIEIPVDSLGGRGHLQVLAVDPEQVVSRVLALEERSKPLVRDVRLTRSGNFLSMKIWRRAML